MNDNMSTHCFTHIVKDKADQLDFLKVGEKGFLRGIFKGSSDSSDDDEDGDEGNEIETKEDYDSKLHTTVVPTTLTEEAQFVSSSSGIKIHLLQDKRKGIAHQLWPAATILCNYIDDNKESFSSHLQRDSVVIELGAGVGLCGLYLSALGCGKVVLTDLTEALEILQHNIKLNSKICSLVEARELRWGNKEDLKKVLSAVYVMPSPPLIIASDCVYWECLFEPLYQTLSELVLETGCTIIIAHVKRWKKDGRFFKQYLRTMRVEVLKEVIEWVVEANSSSGRRSRQISRIYKISRK